MKQGTFQYNMKLNENQNVSAVIQLPGQSEMIEFEITETDLRRMIQLFEMNRLKDMLPSIFLHNH